MNFLNLKKESRTQKSNSKVFQSVLKKLDANYKSFLFFGKIEIKTLDFQSSKV